MRIRELKENEPLKVTRVTYHFPAWPDPSTGKVDKDAKPIEDERIKTIIFTDGEIEKQTEITEAKIKELDLQIENLSELRKELIAQYRLEKEESLKIAKNRDYVKERETDNSELFIPKEPYAVLNNNPLMEKENILNEQFEIFSGRKR